tara:strand:- start:2504 stop:3373 length:870 start_codon:yes stop_codon:yes gene_type:complete
MSLNTKSNIHIFGGSHPLVRNFLKDILEKQKLYAKIYVYGRSFNHGVLAYENFYENANHNDILMSFAPILFTHKIISKVIDKICFKKVIILSSSSIYSKVLKKSMDGDLYRDFLIGEEKIISSSKKSINKEKIYILRTSMLWGLNHDLNVNLIFRILSKYRIFPILKEGNGLRAPLHFYNLSLYISRLCSSKIPSGIYDLMGSEIIKYSDLVKYIQKQISHKTFIIWIPEFCKIFLIKFCKLFKFRKIISYSSMLLRQSEDLVYNFNPLPINLDCDKKFINLLEDTYLN